MKNVKTLTAAILLGLGLLVGGCGNNQQDMQANNQTQQTQQVQQNKGISLAKAIELAKNNQFTPQKVQFEAYINDKVFGDEPEIVAHSYYKIGEHTKIVKIHITDPEVIKKVAKAQEDQKNNFIHSTGCVNANEITFTNWTIEVK